MNLNTKWRLVFLNLSTFCSLPAISSDSVSLCEAYQNFKKFIEHSPSQNEAVLFGLKDQYFRQGLIKPEVFDSQAIDEPLSPSNSSPQIVSNFAFLFSPEENPSPQSISKLESVLSPLIKENIRLRKHLSALLKTTETLDECLFVLDQKRFDSTFYLKKMNQYSEQTAPQLRTLQNIKTALHISNFLSRQQWAVKQKTSLAQVFNQVLSSPHPVNLILPLHSDPTGRLYDSEGRTFPATFFVALKEKINSLIIYSCHSSKVIGHYFKNKSDHAFPIAIPILSKSATKFWGDTMPGKYLKSFYRQATQKDFLSFKKSSPRTQRECIAKIEGPVAQGLEIYLNGNLIGFTSTDLEKTTQFILLPFQLLQKNNTMIIKSSFKAIPYSSRPLSMTLTCPDSGADSFNRRIGFKSFALRQDYVMSYRAKFSVGHAFRKQNH